DWSSDVCSSDLEVAVNLKDFIDAADNCPLKEKLRGNTQEQVNIQRIRVRYKRPCRCATVQGLQHRRFNFIEAFILEVVAQSADDLNAGHGILAGFFTQYQIVITLTHASIFCHISKGHRHRT